MPGRAITPKANGVALDPHAMFGAAIVRESIGMKSWGDHERMPADVPRRAWYVLLALVVLLTLV